MTSFLDKALDEMDEIQGADPEETPETPPEETEETPAQEAETVEEAEEQAPEEEQTAAEKLYAGKYKSAEDLETAYAELQSRLGSQGEELGKLRTAFEQLSERIPEQEDDYVPLDDSTVNWFDRQMEENPIQAMEWARQNDNSGMLYNRGLTAWMDLNPAQATTYQQAVMVKALREEFAETLNQQTKPLQEQNDIQTLNAAWSQAVREIPDLEQHGDAIVQEAKDSPEIWQNAKTVDERVRAFHKLYRLVKGSAATSLETAKEEADTEQKAANRAAKLSGTAPQTKAVAPEPEMSEGEKWLAQYNWDEHAKRYQSDE